MVKVTWPPPKVEVAVNTCAAAEYWKSHHPRVTRPKSPAVIGRWLGKGLLLLVTVLALLGIGSYAPPSFLTHFTVFVLACFIGWQVIWNVTASLHTPSDECDQCDQRHYRDRGRCCIWRSLKAVQWASWLLSPC